jgi:mono/diheme cytochrome c family protein
MVQMVPRLWTYQIEFPARTVVHISLGMAMGAALAVKIGIVRFFRRLDQALVPLLGTLLLIGSVVLIGISVPAAFREAWATGQLFTEENRQRIQRQLSQAGLEPTQVEAFASIDSLRAGQRILRRDCVECHDLRTVLARPRTPRNWRQTVGRMAERTALGNRLDQRQQWQVTAYLIALSPQLQKSTQQLRDLEERRDQAKQAADAVAARPVDTPSYDPDAARQLFESRCSQCHATSLVSDMPPTSAEEARDLVSRMVDEGLEESQDELTQIARYLTETYVKAAE